MKKIIALILVLMLALTVFVACKKDDPSTDDPKDSTSDSTPADSNQPGDSSNNDSEPTETEELVWDDVEGKEKDNYKGEGIELPIIPVG